MPKKPDWLYRQSAAIPIIDDKVVLVTSRSGKRWTVPKGVIERSMTPWDSAAKEAHEEAGVTGNIETEEIGSFTYSKWGGKCTVKVYRLHVDSLLDDWDEMEVRDRICVPHHETSDLPMHEPLAELIRQAFA